MLKIGDHPTKKFRAPLDQFHPLELKCHAENMVLPQAVDGGANLVNTIDIDNFYMISQIGYYEHQIKYRAGKEQDYLRIIIDRANTKIRMQRLDKKAEENKSYRINGGEVQVLLSTSILEGVDYIIFIEFGEIDNTYELESSDQFCQSFKMQIKSSSSAIDCRQNDISQDDLLLPVNYLQSDNDYKSISIGINKKSKIVQTINIGDKIKNNNRSSDLEVTIDHSSIFFIQAVTLYFSSSANDNKNSVSEYMRVAENEIKPVEIMDDIKNLVKYRFKSLTPNTNYDIVISLLKKPSTCQVSFQLVLQTSSPLDQSALLERDYMGILQQYVSQTQIQDMNRYVEVLPISLDTYKYFSEENFILVSEYLQLSAESLEQNKMTFTITQNKTLFRMYVENGDILLRLHEVTTKQSVQDRKTNTLWGMLNEGKYEVQFDFFTDLIKEQVLYKQDKIHVTIMIAQQSMYEDKYQQVQGNRIKNCEKNKNFPLALNRKTSKQNGENDAVYSYPFIRLNQDTLYTQYIIDTYSFRLNETSRFQINMGMHFLTSHLTLLLSDYHSFGQQYLGKQLFNENQIDVILPPGDYALAIGQPSLFENPSYSLGKEETNKIECGLYSFNAHIQPLSNTQTSMQQSQVNTLSKCPVKEVAPMKIYSDESETKGGGEYFINSEGTFFKMFEGVLYRKSEQSTVNPEFDRVIIESKEDSVLSIMMQFKQKGNTPIIKLHDQFGFDKYEEPLTVRDNEAAGKIMELSVLFKVQKGHSYTLFIYYGGEITFDQDGQEACEYYNLYVAVNHVSFLQNEFKCVKQRENQDPKTKEVFNFNKELPKKITDADFDSDRLFKFKHFMEFKYPTDYNALKQLKNTDMIYKGIDLQVSSEYDLRVQVQSDFPDFFVGLGVVEQVPSESNDKTINYEDISEQLPLFPISGKIFEPTLSRQIKGSKIDSNKKVSLVFIDEQSKPLLDYIQKISTKQQASSTSKQQDEKPIEMCLYFELTIAMKLQETPAQLLAAPQIIAISPETNSKEPFSLSQTQSQISIGLQLSSTPYSTKQQQNSKFEKITPQQMQDLVTLKFYNPSNEEEALYFKKAVKIQRDKQQGLFFTFIFDIQSEQEKSNESLLNAILNIDLEGLVNDKGVAFEMKKKVRLPKFSFQVEEDDKTKKKEAEENESEIHQKKIEIAEKQKDKATVEVEVKCLCVHGKCNKGSSKCNKCDAGWEGTLCDIKKDAKNINKDNGRIGSKMRKVKDESEADSKIWAVHDDEIKGDTTFKKDTMPIQSQNSIVSFFSTASSEIYSFFSMLFTLIFESILAILCLGIAIYIGKYLYSNGFFLKNALARPYMSVPSDEGDEFNSPNKAMELAELKPTFGSRGHADKQTKGKASKEEHKYEKMSFDDDKDEEDDFSTQKLSKELMLYSDMSEQDQAQMYQSSSPNQEKIRFDEEQPQHVNEVDTANEIDDVLKEMNYDDDDGDNSEDENQKFF